MDLEVGDITVVDDSPIIVVAATALQICPFHDLADIILLATKVDNSSQSKTVCVQHIDGDEVTIKQN